MVFIVPFLAAFLGRFLRDGILNFIFKPEEHDNLNPEYRLGWTGAIGGVIISVIIYKS